MAQGKNGRTQASVLKRIGLLDAEKGIYAVPIIMFILLSFLSPHFLTMNNISNLLTAVTVVGIVALGQTLVIITGGIDLSVSSLISLTGCLAIGTYLQFGLAGSIAITLLAGLLIGAVNGLFISKGKIEPFITTLAMASILQTVVLFYTNGYPKYIRSADRDATYGSDFLYIGGGKLFNFVPLSFVILIVSAIVLHIVLMKTRLGRYIFAIGGNKETARLSGVNVGRITVITYMLCGFFASLAGIVYASRIGTGLPNMGTGYELQSIAAVVIGGTVLAGGRGGVFRTLAGTFVFGILANGINLLGLSNFIQYAVIGVVILIAVLLNELNRRGRR